MSSFDLNPNPVSSPIVVNNYKQEQPANQITQFIMMPLSWHPVVQILMAYVVLVILGILPNPLKKPDAQGDQTNSSSFVSNFLSDNKYVKQMRGYFRS